MNRQRWVVFSLMFAVVVLTGATAQASFHPHTSQVGLADNWGKMPLYFIANQGQMDAHVAFYVQGSDKSLYFASDGVTFALNDLTPQPLSSQERGEGKGRWNVKLDFVGANAVQPIGQDKTDAIISYFKGSQDEWHTGLPTFGKIVYRDLWEGIDLVYSGTANRLKYEFVVQPGVDPAHIRLAYRGATVHVNETGQLEASTPVGGFQDDAPLAYQEVNGQRVPVAVSYALENSAAYGFHLGAYDSTLPLVVDPAVLVYCGYIGGSGDDEAFSIAVDSQGSAYVVGYAASAEATFPVTVGPDLTYNSGTDAFVAKVKADGTGLVYAGYIGGAAADYGYGIAADSAGNAYIAGRTWSNESTFPVTVGPDLTFNGGERDAFVAKVKSDGTGLVYCGYIGSNNIDDGTAIAVDAAGSAYVTGMTNQHVFVAKVKADGTGLVYTYYIGGSNQDWGRGIAVDAMGNAYVTGITNSGAGLPVTVGPDLTYNGNWDGFVAKVKADGTGLVYFGYLGGTGHDEANAIAVDAAGSAYITGFTSSTEATFPVAVGPDLTYNGGTYDAFVAKVKPDGTGFVYAGYIGGSLYDGGYGIAVNSAGNAYITGYTSSTETTFPVTNGPDLTFNGGDDAFVAKVKADGTGLVYAGYIGGSGQDEDSATAADGSGNAIAVDGSGNVYITGYTKSFSNSFPVTVGPDLTNNGSWDAFVAKVSTAASLTGTAPNSAMAGGAAFTLTITGTNFIDGSVVRWNGSDRTTTFVNSTQVHATIAATDIAAAGVAYVTVFNPTPDGATSNAQPFYITTTGTGVTTTDTQTGSNPSASTGSNGVTATATGTGTVSVANYAANPAGTSSFGSAGAYVDVHIASGSSFTSLSIVDCYLNGGKQAYWWNGTTWALASNQSYDAGTSCATITVNNSTSPSLSDLTGTPFGAGSALYLPLILR